MKAEVTQLQKKGFICCFYWSNRYNIYVCRFVYTPILVVSVFICSHLAVCLIVYLSLRLLYICSSLTKVVSLLVSLSSSVAGL